MILEHVKKSGIDDAVVDECDRSSQKRHVELEVIVTFTSLVFKERRIELNLTTS